MVVRYNSLQHILNVSHENGLHYQKNQKMFVSSKIVLF